MIDKISTHSWCESNANRLIPKILSRSLLPYTHTYASEPCWFGSLRETITTTTTKTTWTQKCSKLTCAHAHMTWVYVDRCWQSVVRTPTMNVSSHHQIEPNFIKLKHIITQNTHLLTKANKLRTNETLKAWQKVEMCMLWLHTIKMFHFKIYISKN